MTVLDDDIYSEATAARLLGIAPSTLHYWLEGGTRRDVTYQPILRLQPRGQRLVTWAEFIEAGWLRAYRQKRVPMRELRAFIDVLRTEFGVPFPLAHRQPLVSGRDLVVRAQEAAHLTSQYHLVDESGLLTYPGRDFMERVDWDGDLALGYNPAADPGSTVRVRPDVRFGRPAVGGVSTATVWELYDEGVSRDEVAQEYGLTASDVRWAISFEEASAAA